MATKRVFILGAGFSKQAGMPLATELTNNILGKFRGYEQEEFLEWFGHLQERIDWLEGGKSNRINIEQVFDLAQFDVELWKMRQQLTTVGRRNGDTHWDMAQSIELWLSYMEKFLRDIIWEEQKKARGRLDSIKKFSTHLNPDDAVVTFNYDCLLEDSLTQQNKEWYYGFAKENKTGIKILKMHGSINWAMVPRDQQNNFEYTLLFRKEDKNVDDHNMKPADELEYNYVLLKIPDEYLSNRIENRDLQWSNKQYGIAIAGLGRYKPLSELVGSGKVWTNAFRALHECEQIYIVGFSLSPFDTMARLHFGGVMMERYRGQKLELPKIVLIDRRAGDLVDNFKSVFGRQSIIDLIQKPAQKVEWGKMLL